MAEGGFNRGQDDSRKLNLAIIGKSNSGKSSLIKALLQAQFPLGSDICLDLPVTDALECTRECTPYYHRDSPVVLWDVPGCGTQNEPIENYEKRIEMSQYDGFIVCCGGPVTEDELYLNNLIALKGRRYIFVRTKIDIALENDKKAHPSTFSITDALKRIRTSIEEKLSENGVLTLLVSSNLGYTGYTDDFRTLQFLVFNRESLSDFMKHSNRKVSRGNKSGISSWKRF